MTGGEPASPLPPRQPRPPVVHWLVDSAVVFLVVVVVALFFGVSLWWVVVVALVGGLVLTPLTRRAEDRGLAARDRPDPQGPA